MRRPRAMSRSPTRARSSTSIRRKTTSDGSTIGPATARMVVRGLARTSEGRKFEAIVKLFRPAHFGLRVALRDEPGADAARYFANTARLKTVEADAVYFRFLRDRLDSDLHMLLATESQGPTPLPMNIGFHRCFRSVCSDKAHHDEYP